MAKLTWDEESVRRYETGISNVVVYPYIDADKVSYIVPALGAGVSIAGYKGYAWDGVTGITESPSGAEASAVYADNIKYFNLISDEELGLTLEAVQYPEEFEKCDGTEELVAGVKIGQQSRIPFGLSYLTKVMNANGVEIGQTLHIVWNALAAPSEKAYSTVNESPENMTFSWTLTTTKVPVEGTETKFKPISHLEVNLMNGANPHMLLMALIHGDDNIPVSPDSQDVKMSAMLPSPSDILKYMDRL